MADQVLTGTLDPLNGGLKVRYIRLTVTGSGQVTFDNDNPGHDSYLALYSSNGGLVASNNDGPNGPASQIVASLAPGTYFLAISDMAATPTNAEMLAGIDSPYAGGSIGFTTTIIDSGNIISSAVLEGAETLNGTTGADTIYGLTGDDVINGNGGNDALHGGTGDDRLVLTAPPFAQAFGDDGNDTLVLDFSTATQNVGTLAFSTNSAGGYDAVYSGPGRADATSIENFEITTGAGNFQDFIRTGNGNDVLSLGGGDDQAFAGGGGLVADGGDGVDGISASFSSATTDIVINLQTNTFTGVAGSSIVNFEYFLVDGANPGLATGSGNDTIVTTNVAMGDNIDAGGGNDTITIINGNDTVKGGSGTDTLVIDWSGTTSSVGLLSGPTVNGTGGYDGTFWDSGNGRRADFVSIENFHVTTGDQNDTITLGNGDDQVRLNGGDDFANVGAGLITADGGAGVDGLAADLSAVTSAITVNLQTNEVTGASGVAITNFEYLGSSSTSAFSTGSGDDVIVTTNAAKGDYINANGGNDSVTVFNGSDTVNGGAGSDTLIIDWSAATDPVGTLSMGTDTGNGYDFVFTSTGRRIDATSIEHLVITTGSGDDNFFTTDTGDIVDPGSGNNTVNTRGGDDQLTIHGGTTFGDTGTNNLTLGSGTDTLVVDYSGLNASGNGDVSIAAPTADASGYAGTASISGNTRITFSGVDALHITTGAGTDSINGTGGNDIVATGAGNDAINTGGGNDWLDGGAGDDAMAGGAGDDAYIVDSASDVVTENASEGTDEIRTGLASYSIAALTNVENLTGTASTGQSLTGNGGANVITAGSGNDVLDGGAGADTMIGGAGADLYEVDDAADTVVESAADNGTGFDTVETSLASYSLGANVENLVGQSAAGQTLSGNGLVNVIVAAAGNDAINGGDNNDVLQGRLGNDILDGGTGADQMIGGGGDDVYIVDNVGDLVQEGDQEGAGPGNDEVRTTLASYSIAALTDIEDLTGLLDTGQTLTGNDGDNSITGGNGADTLTGGGSTDGDVLTGNDGNDRLIVSTGLNSIVFGGAGTDTFVLQAGGETGGFTMAAPTVDGVNGGLEGSIAEAGDTLGVAFSGIEKFDITTGSGDDSIVTGGGGDVISTGGGKDVLDGGAGADIMTGGVGDDIYYVDDAGDQVIENGSEGTDEVRTTLANYTLAANVEKLTFIGSGDFHATGTTGSETFRGGAGDDVIDGGGGSDFFDLRDGGNDDATGGSAVDVFYYGAALTGADQNHGGGGNDVVAIQGDYSGGITLGTGSLDSVETLSLLSHSDTRFGGDGASPYSYDIVADDGAVAAGQRLTVNASTLEAGENFTFDGSAETDGSFFIYGGQGTDDLTGGGGVDVFFFAENRFGASDHVNGGTGSDIMVLRGDYNLTLTGTEITNVETVTLMSGSDARFYSAGTDFNYSITTSDDTVANGATMTFNGGGLRSSETLTFDGSAELDGNFRIFGGAGDDAITGGHGNDLIYGGLGQDVLNGGAGNDVFRFQDTSESVGGSEDQIQDFTMGDLIDLSRIDAISGTSGNDAFTFVSAGAFTGHAGELIAQNGGGGIWTVSGDVDGDGNADFQLIVVSDHAITGNDFML